MMLYDTLAGASDPVRHAALLLHAMPEADQAWALGQLPQAQQAQLAGLLQELRALGIPQDRGLIDEAVASMTESMATAPVSLSQLDPAGVQVLGALLGKEPAQLVARLLACGPWAWQEALLAQLAPAQRRQVEKLRRALPSGTEATALRDALVRNIETQIFQAVRTPPLEVRPLAPRPSFRLASALLRRIGTSV